MSKILVAKVTIGLGGKNLIDSGAQLTEANIKDLGKDLDRLKQEGHVISVEVAEYAFAKAAVESAEATAAAAASGSGTSGNSSA
jgi:hypothetical protein